MCRSVCTVSHTFVCCLAVAISSNGSLQLASTGSEGVQGLQTLTMTNSNPSQPTILQYAQTADGQQILLPSNQVVLQGKRDIVNTCGIRLILLV